MQHPTDYQVRRDTGITFRRYCFICDIHSKEHRYISSTNLAYTHKVENCRYNIGYSNNKSEAAFMKARVL